MKTILISLRENPYQDFILGNKKFEYRKKWIKEECFAYIYVTQKTKRIMLKIEFGKPIYKTKEEIAKIAKNENPDWYHSTLKYFEKYQYGYAVPVLKIIKLKKTKSLDWMKKNNLIAPQNYIFLNEDYCKKIEN